jgi:hypothetical protein
MTDLEALLAKQAITEQIMRYARALDRCDRDLLRSVFHEDCQHDHGPYQGLSSVFLDTVWALLYKLDRTQHRLGNNLIDLIDDTHALSETYCTAYHRIAAGMEEAIFPDHDLAIDEDLWIGPRYLQHWERRNGQWKLAKHCGIEEWHRWAPASERGFANVPASQKGARSPDDRSYHLPLGDKTYALAYRDDKVKPA